MSWVRNLVVLLKSNVQSLWVLDFIFISKELSIDLDMNDWVVWRVHIFELNGPSLVNLIFLWVIPSSCLSERGWYNLINFCLNLECFSDIKDFIFEPFLLELELDRIRSPFHVFDIIKLDFKGWSPISNLKTRGQILCVRCIVNLIQTCWLDWGNGIFLS